MKHDSSNAPFLICIVEHLPGEFHVRVSGGSVRTPEAVMIDPADRILAGGLTLEMARVVAEAVVKAYRDAGAAVEEIAEARIPEIEPVL